MAIKSRPFSVSLARDTKYLFFPCWKMEKYSEAHRSKVWIETHTWCSVLPKILWKRMMHYISHFVEYITMRKILEGTFYSRGKTRIPPVSLNLCNLKRNPGPLGIHFSRMIGKYFEIWLDKNVSRLWKNVDHKEWQFCLPVRKSVKKVE